MGCPLSSTIPGSSAFASPDIDAGPVNPMVAYVSSTRSGTAEKNAGLIPEAFQLALKGLLNTPSGVSMIKFV